MKSTTRFLLLILLALGAGAGAVDAQTTGTVMPTPYQTVLDGSGNPVANAKICTYIAGTTTPVATYTDAALSVASANPIRADGSGRFVVYLTPGASYKFVYQTSSGTAGTCDGASIKTVDNVSAVPPAAASLDVTGTVGESITAGQAVYLSDGSGSKTAGQWYKADSANAYSSTLPEVGIAPSAIASGAAGTVRLAGQVTGLSSLTVGATYYAGSAGAVTSTAPTLKRFLGQADSATSLVLTGDPPPPVAAGFTGFCGLRLSLTTATPVTVTDVTAATTVFITPTAGGQCAFYDGTATWTLLTNSETSVAVPATTSKPFDVFCRNNSNTIACDTTDWTSDSARATALVLQNGVWVKSGDTTRRYIGTARTTTVSGQTEDSVARRFVWSYYQRARRILRVTDTTDSWTYTTNTYRQANAAAANQVDVVIGVAEGATLDLTVIGFITSGSANQVGEVSVGEDSTSTALTTVYGGGTASAAGGTGAGSPLPCIARLQHYPAIGRHFYVWLEKANGGGTVTWYGDNADGTGWRAGITGWIEG
jgi:hypothetical protein